MGTNCAPIIAVLFSYYYERDFMSDLHKSKWYDLIDMINHTCDISTIYSPSLTLNLKNIFPDIYPTKCQLNKANTSDKETSFLDLKIIGSDVHTCIETIAMTSDFLSSISCGWVVIFIDSHLTVFTFCMCTALWLIRRWGLYEGTCPNLLRGNNALILVPTDR